MTSPLICTPLWCARIVLYGALPSSLLHAGRWQSRPMTADGPLLTMGVATALAEELRPGDLFIASELRTSTTHIMSPCGALLHRAVRRLGLRAYLGPLLLAERGLPSPKHCATASGALATDVESAYLARLPHIGTAVDLRVITSAAAAQPRSPSTMWSSLAALRALRAAAPAMNQWVAATGQRELLLASPRSFCAGVERAVQIVAGALERFGEPVYVRRQIVHNKHVVSALQARGAVFVEELDGVPDGSTVVLAAHGVAPEVRREARARGLRVVDATCPLVQKVHSEVRRYTARGHTVFIIGHDDHDEVVGTRGEAPEDVIVVADPVDAATAEPADPTKVAYVMQTTLAADEAEQTAAVLRQRFPAILTPSRDDICYATTNRQAAMREVAQLCDLVLVLGSQNSSNSQRLAEVAAKYCSSTYLVDDASSIDLCWLAGARRVGISAGASAPPHLADEVIDCLAALGPTTVREVAVTQEDIHFALPKVMT
jgi:4-hydroxy-3-methylbut-2-en-1-yl diphosphate reductase